MKKILFITCAALSFCFCANNNSKKAQSTAAEEAAVEEVAEDINAEDLDAQYAKDLLAAGTEAPEFSAQTPEGTMVSLSDFKGSYVVVDFWASWCGDCRRDIPNIKAAYERFSPAGVKFVGVSFDDKKDAWTGAIEEFGLEYTQISELKKWKETNVSPLYNISWIPSMYLIGPDGKVVMATVQSEKLVAKLAEITKL